MFHKSFFRFWGKYKFKSIVVKNSLKICAIFCAVMIIPVTVLYKMTLTNSQRQAVEESGLENKKISATVEALFRDMEYLGAEIISSSDVVYYMTLTEQGFISEADMQLLVEKVQAYMSGKKLIDSVYIYSEGKRMICTDKECVPVEEFDDTGWIDEFSEGFEKGYKLLKRNTSYNVISMMKRYVSNKSGVVININMTELEKYILDLHYRDTVFYIVDNTDIMYTNIVNSRRDTNVENAVLEMLNKSLTTMTYEKNGNSLFFVSEESPYYQWDYVSIHENTGYSAKIKRTYYSGVLLFVLLMIIIIFAAMSLSVNGVSQVVNLLEIFNNRQIYQTLSENEISDIASKIILLLDDNELLKRKVQAQQIEYEQLITKALQAQMTPHFLNNTLAAINIEAFKAFEGDNKISSMIVKLSRMLEYTLVSDEILVSLEREVRFINDYVELLRYRYGTFELSVTVPEEMREVKVIKMCIQPLIENAVFHGIRKQGGKIDIICLRSETGISIVVCDNGEGMDDETIKKLNDSFKNDDLNEENIGLKNVYKRLKIIFGEKSDVVIESKEGEYTRIVLMIPHIEE